MRFSNISSEGPPVGVRESCVQQFMLQTQKPSSQWCMVNVSRLGVRASRVRQLPTTLWSESLFQRAVRV